ncbi:MAG: class I SAM-dependent methyltransferase [Planctomycetes bacterium]|nr:class I SAM-dependent methyltransferase [Planctomycetota bacterium]
MNADARPRPKTRTLPAPLRTLARRTIAVLPAVLLPPSIRVERERQLKNNFDKDAVLAKAAYRHFNPRASRAELRAALPLVERAAELGCLGWPKKVCDYVRQRDVLDVGCGDGLHGIGFILVGANSYTGVDPWMDLDLDQVKNSAKVDRFAFGWGPREIMAKMPRIRLFNQSLEAMDPKDQYDIAILHNVTEHLIDLKRVFAEIPSHLKPEGELLYNHHNFYSWNGHHRAPKTVAELNPDDEEQRVMADWAHLDFDPPPGHAFNRKLNRIRIPDLEAVTARYFDILEWTLVPSKDSEGAGRLMPEVRARHPQLAEYEFTTQHVLCHARVRT